MSSEQVSFNNPQITGHENALAMPGNIRTNNNTTSNKFSLRFLIITNIISVFIGEKLSKVLQQLEKVSKGKLSPDEKTDLKLNIIGRIPEILLDNTDRNRTSPFAFTGNKFEFRAVGSKTNCANPITILNTIVANQLLEFKTEVDLLISKKDLS